MALVKAAHSGADAASSAPPVATSTEVMASTKDQEAAPCSPIARLVPVRPLSADTLTWGQLQAKMECILQAGARGVGREIEEASAAASSANHCADQLACDLAESREDLQKMKELAMEEIPSSHTARLGEETSNGIYTGACHVLAFMRLAHRDLDLKEALDRGAADDAPCDPEYLCHCRYVEVEDVQQCGQPDTSVVIPALTLEPHVPEVEIDQSPSVETNMNVLADRDRRIQYWKTKLEVAELERTIVEAKKDQAMETLRGREVWFNSYLKGCCTAMAEVCRELRVPRGDPMESAAGYISWMKGAYAQL
uniref:Uncharacterized protein n=1 Tax=Oryza sativa subsp. japonica TaxID=39947 RepID=Q33B08_ORYSJ|nr:hypothetical protein LOC_Os10g06210 [Oryza sativa Japonica Group]